MTDAHWLCLQHIPDGLFVAEPDNLRKHILTGEEAILIAVGDQLARTLPDQSGDEKLLHQDHSVC